MEDNIFVGASNADLLKRKSPMILVLLKRKNTLISIDWVKRTFHMTHTVAGRWLDSMVDAGVLDTVPHKLPTLREQLWSLITREKRKYVHPFLYKLRV